MLLSPLFPAGYTPYATAQHKLTMAENFGLAGIAAVVSKARTDPPTSQSRRAPRVRGGRRAILAHFI